MKYPRMDWGQMEAVVNKLGGMKGVKDFLSDRLKVVPVGGLTFAFELAKRHYPKKFFQTRKGLYVWENFTSRILPVAKTTAAGKKYGEVTSYKLAKVTTGEEWLRTHPNDVWDATDLCAWLSIQLMLQSEGQDGFLPNDGYFNLFLVRGVEDQVFVVSVGWDSVSREWNGSAWTLGHDWDAGDRFFSKPT